jgi:type VI secretion system protein ImpA
MNHTDLELLLQPLPGDAPCGPDLEYDPAFMALDTASRGKPEQQFGDTLIPAQEPNWRDMQAQAKALLERTRDLRVAVHLLRAETRLDGTDGFCGGIRLVHGLLQHHWAAVHPQLDAGDNDDPTMRMNALAPLVDAATVLADLRAARVGHDRFLTVRHLELSLGKVEPHGDESVPAEAQLAEAAASMAQQPGDPLATLQAAHDAVRGIEAVIDQRVGAAGAPELRPLRLLTQNLAAFVQLGRGHAAPATSDGDVQPSANGAAVPAATPSGRMDAIHTRADAVKALERVCEWIDRNEPTNPAPLLIRRAQRLMGKSFMDIIRDLAPDSLKDVERLAGVEPD